MALVGGRVAPSGALKDLLTQFLLEGINMTNDRRAMDSERIRGGADRSQANDVIGGPDLVPLLHVLSLALARLRSASHLPFPVAVGVGAHSTTIIETTMVEACLPM